MKTKNKKLISIFAILGVLGEISTSIFLTSCSNTSNSSNTSSNSDVSTPEVDLPITRPEIPEFDNYEQEFEFFWSSTIEPIYTFLSSDSKNSEIGLIIQNIPNNRGIAIENIMNANNLKERLKNRFNDQLYFGENYLHFDYYNNNNYYQYDGILAKQSPFYKKVYHDSLNEGYFYNIVWTRNVYTN